MNDTPHGESAEIREKKLKLALAKSEALKVKWPTVAIPVTGFSRKRLVD